MKKYRVVLRTIYGCIEVDDIEANSEIDAEIKAGELVKKEIDCSKVDEIYEYKKQ